MDTASLTPFVYPAAELSEADLLVRRGRITSSVAPMICGESEFGGPLRAYREILGIEAWKGNPSTVIGKLDEPKIGALHQLRHKGVSLYRAGTVVHPEHDWLAASIDFLAVDGEGARYLVEAKSTDERNRQFWGAPGTAEVPAGYRIQVAVQLACWGLERAVFGLLIGRDDYREYVVERNPEFGRNLIALLAKFRDDHLVPRIPPADEDRRLYVQTAYPQATEQLRVADDEMETVACFEDVRRLARERKAAELAYERAVAELCAQIGEAEGVVVAGQKVTWKREGRSRERVLRVPPAFHRIDVGDVEEVAHA